jgi:hypothetical protein
LLTRMDCIIAITSHPADRLNTLNTGHLAYKSIYIRYKKRLKTAGMLNKLERVGKMT